jgi:hypothetical protein
MRPFRLKKEFRLPRKLKKEVKKIERVVRQYPNGIPDFKLTYQSYYAEYGFRVIDGCKRNKWTSKLIRISIRESALVTLKLHQEFMDNLSMDFNPENDSLGFKMISVDNKPINPTQ